ncbi:ATP-dependent protease LonB, partial [Candidatus Micrarchaeota archaeon]|nr:ATP-dependent protease LonB [Candidatus Micrarchaeota archaeon]
MLAQAMAELLPKEQLSDVVALHNVNGENNPIIKSFPSFPDYNYLTKHKEYLRYYTPRELLLIKTHTEEKKTNLLPIVLKNSLGRRITRKIEEKKKGISPTFILLLLAIVAIGLVFVSDLSEDQKWFILATIFGLGLLYFVSSGMMGLTKRMGPAEHSNMKLIVDNSEKTHAPFVDATGSKAGALLGDVKHDPLQSGGLGTPAHLRVEGGAVHRANNGVLFIDEIASLKMNWQQELLTAMQEKKYAITGQSEMSSGALVKTNPVPCDFVLVGAGNLQDISSLHPAFRSRIRGNGYEVYVEDVMDDTPQNEEKIVQFIAQEIAKDKKIPPFTYAAVQDMIKQARIMAGRKGKLTVKLRELGGLIRAAGDVAVENKKKIVEPKDIKAAKKIFLTIESQLVQKIVERKKEYKVFSTTGGKIGKVNGLAVLGEGTAGIVLPIVAEVTPSSSKGGGKIIATGKLGKIAKEAVENVSAIFKKYGGVSLSNKDIHIQFLQTYEGVEGDSASISIALAVISDLEQIKVKQSYGMTGSLSVRGEVLPVGGVSAKVEAAVNA